MTLQPNTDFEVWANIEVPYEGTDALLPSEVHNIRMDYPFSVVHGDYNVYSIRPCTTLKGLIAETQRVFCSLWDAGQSNAPHCLEDFVIECIVPHPNNLATIVIGS